jgi:restriction endonuclease S subunit
MSEWPEITLGELLIETDERKGDQVLPLVLSVTEKRGILPQDEVFKKRIATTDTTNYKVLRPLDIAYNPYLLWTRAIGQWLGDCCGITSPVYPTFRTRDGHEPRFVGLLLESGILTPYFDATAIGSIPRRRRTTIPVFLSAVVHAPSLPEQRRIVDLIGAVDAHIEALMSEHSATYLHLDAFLSDRLSKLPGSITVGQLATVRSGPSWAAKDEHKEPVDGAVQVVKITNTPSDGFIDMTDKTYVTNLPESTLLLDQTSMVLIRTNGNRQRIGNVYLPNDEAIGCAVSAFQFIVKFLDPKNRDFVYWTLRDRNMQRKMSAAASGTTGLGNLAAGWLKSAEIPWLDDPGIRSGIVEQMQAIATVVDSLGTELRATRELREILLRGLLKETIRIPDAYESSLEVVR